MDTPPGRSCPPFRRRAGSRDRGRSRRGRRMRSACRNIGSCVIPYDPREGSAFPPGHAYLLNVSNLFAARSQMALSLGFHIVFAEIGIAMPLMMVIAEWRWRRTGDDAYRQVARRWAKGTAMLFAVGAVSGTVLSFELGLLWPRFMQFAGPIIGMPFSLEGFAFFTEAIFLGLYLHGWDRLSPRMHLTAGVIVAASGAASAVFVVMVNGWMNTP